MTIASVDLQKMASKTASGNPRARAGLRRLLQNGVVTVLSLAVTLGAVEVALRLVYVPPPLEMGGAGLMGPAYYQEDPVLGWKPRSNVQGVHAQPGSFYSTFRTNALGLRDRDYPLNKGAASRIVVVGDSFTWGWGVNDNEIYTERLEALLSGVEVINLGVTAYSSNQELEYLKLQGVPYRPDIILLAFCLNDIEEYEIRQEKKRSGKNTSQPEPKQGTAALKAWINGHLYAYRFVIDRINTNKSLVNLLVKMGLKSELEGYEALDMNLRPALKVYAPEFIARWERTKGYLRSIRDVAKDAQARLILVLVPSLQSVEQVAFEHTIAYTKYEPEEFDLEKPYRMLESFAQEEQIEVLNPLPAFRAAQSKGESLYLVNDMHFNTRGHELFAREIYRYLLAHP